MEVVFKDKDLERLWCDPGYTYQTHPHLAKKFRMRIQQLTAAPDPRDLRALKSLHFEKLKGQRSHQHSIKVNDQFRLILELQSHGNKWVAEVVSIEDYH